VRDRVARWGQGWSPLRGGPALFQSTRTPPIETEDDLAAMLRDLGDRLEANGRGRRDVDVMVTGPSVPLEGPGAAERCLDELGRLSELGVTWFQVHVPLATGEAAIDGLRRFGAEVIARA
jgi:hypothetical protein